MKIMRTCDKYSQLILCVYAKNYFKKMGKLKCLKHVVKNFHVGLKHYRLFCMSVTQNQGIHSLHKAKLLVCLVHHPCISQTNGWDSAFSLFVSVGLLPMCRCTYGTDDINDIRAPLVTLL